MQYVVEYRYNMPKFFHFKWGKNEKQIFCRGHELYLLDRHKINFNEDIMIKMFICNKSEWLTLFF